MSSKFTYDNYTITAEFKNDFNLSITASDNYSGDYFLNEGVELTKIKKDTVIATLSRKNENNLKCQFSTVDVEPKKLIIQFKVTFDFLPPFSEYVYLDQIQNKKGLNKVESAEIRSDIEDLQRLMSSLTTNSGSIPISESSASLNPKADVYKQQLTRGSYLIEISGYFTCASTQKHDIAFNFEVGKDCYSSNICLYTNSSYGFPFNIRQQIIVSNQETLRITAEHKQGLASTFTSTIVTVSPMLKLR